MQYEIEKLKLEIGPLTKLEQDMAEELHLNGHSDLVQLFAIKDARSRARSIAAEIVNAVFGDTNTFNEFN